MSRNDERNMRARRGAEGGHRVRSPRHPQDRRPSQDRTPVPTSYRNGKAGGSSQGSSDNKRPSQFSGGNGKKSKGKNNTGLYLAVGGIALLVILCIVLVLKFSGKQGAETPESSETEATFAQDVLLQPAVLDLSVLPGAAELTAPSVENSTEESGSGAAATGLLDIQGMTPEEVREKVAELYSWNLVVYNDKADVGAVVKPTVDANATTEAATLGDAENPDSLPKDEAETADPALQEITVTNEYAVPDLVNEKLNELLTQIVADNEAYRQQMSEEAAAETDPSSQEEAEAEEESTSGTAEESRKVYTLSLDGLEDAVGEVAEHAATMWYKMPKGGSIGSFNKETNKFVMEGAEAGFEVNKDELSASILSAISEGNFEARIQVPGTELSAEEATAASEYKIIGSFSTNTTANKVRNKNIQLACQAINGTILRPGEEFSFNNTVGERTEAKGYGAATAYNEGEVVQEVGGGICQVSTTLYNAVLKSGLKTTKRQSHTFEPNYVTPGMDATVSWGGPDYRFANVPSHAEYSNSDSYSIGIYAEYSNQKVTISIYGRPVLKDGYSYSLSSKKVKDIDVVRKLIEPGSDKKPTTGTKGSQWTTNLVVKKDGEVVSDKLDHNTYYSGHIEYYTDTPAATETSSPAETTTPVESSSENLPTDTLPMDTMPQHETGISGGPGVTSAYPQAGPTGTTEAYGPGVPSQPAQTEPQTQAPTAPQTTAAPEAPQAPTAGPTPGGTEAPQSPVSSGPISDAPPAL